MSLKLHVAVSRKLGLPNYSSVGATCGVETELPESLLRDESTALEREIQQAYTLCREAVDAELASSQESPPGDPSSDSCQPPNAAAAGGNGNGRRLGPSDCPASVRQLGYLHRLAAEIMGSIPDALDVLAGRLAGKSHDALTRRDASELIERLRNIRDGEIDLVSLRGEEAIDV